MHWIRRLNIPGMLRTAACLALPFALACAASTPPWPEGTRPEDPAAESLRASVARVASARWNPGRLAAARERGTELGLAELGGDEWIDWFAIQRNHVIEIAGSGDGLAYLVAHYDKADTNPISFVSMLLNGLIDVLLGWSYLSQGAVDNATGVAVVLQLAHDLKELNPRLTWRILLTGAEESGLRGSRAHVARLSQEDWARLRFAINVDSVAMTSSPNCVMSEGSHPALVAAALEVAEDTRIPLETGQLRSRDLGDHAPFDYTSFPVDLMRGIRFNFVGGLLPQRSWFTRGHGTRVLTFASCYPPDELDLAGSLFMLPIGRYHGPRDNTKRVDALKLYEQYALLRTLIMRLDAKH